MYVQTTNTTYQVTCTIRKQLQRGGFSRRCSPTGSKRILALRLLVAEPGGSRVVLVMPAWMGCDFDNHKCRCSQTSAGVTDREALAAGHIEVSGAPRSQDAKNGCLERQRQAHEYCQLPCQYQINKVGASKAKSHVHYDHGDCAGL